MTGAAASVTALDSLVVGGRTLTLRRAWPSSREHLVLEYLSPTGEVVAAQWHADPQRRHELVARSRQPVVDLGAAGVVLQPGGADRKLPALAAIAAQPGARLVSHRAERRAVVQRADGCYLKVVRPGRSEAVADAAARAGVALRDRAEVPRLLDHDAERGVLVWSTLGGTTLHERGREAATDRGWAEAWRSSGRVLRALHDAAPAGLRTRDTEVEVRAVTRWLAPARALGLLPDGPDPEAPPPAGPDVVTLHGDLHDKQLVVDPSRRGARVGLLDLDELSAGEPAIDLANLLVHLELRVLQGLDPAAADVARAALLDGWQPDPEVRARAAVLSDLVRLRLAGLYAFRPPWRRLARELYARAA